jgi:nucleosome binding factor SPN SPT16 subunit
VEEALVPFHISTIKNVSKNDEGGVTLLRINFVAPTAAGASTGMPKESAADDHFIREITLKARQPTNLNNTFRLIKELRKRVQAREKQEALEADLVTQAALQLIKTGKVHRLRDCYARPTVGGKKAPGTLELHANGLRFVTGRGEKLDLIFKNIKLALFQAAEKEIIVVLHFHLHNPIMIGKKKTKDVQFYVEVMESSYALDAARRSGYDPDELEEEQRERQLRKRMNAEFQNFAKKIEDQAGKLEFDIPYRELGFYGVPPHNKSTCYVMPAVNALVELTEPPWFVVPLNDIEVASFERVVYGLKNFDLTLVMKDFAQKPVQVSAINVEHLDSLKTWLDNCNIKFYEGTANLNWTQIIKHITSMGLQDFYDEGGWKNVLGMDPESGSGSDDPEDQESDFEPSGDEEEDSEDDYDDEVDSEVESEGEELDSDESEGKDFDELEEEAVEADKQYDEDERVKGKAKAKGERSRRASEADTNEDKRPPAKKAKATNPGGVTGALKGGASATSSKSLFKRP